MKLSYHLIVCVILTCSAEFTSISDAQDPVSETKDGMRFSLPLEYVPDHLDHSRKLPQILMAEFVLQDEHPQIKLNVPNYEIESRARMFPITQLTTEQRTRTTDDDGVSETESYSVIVPATYSTERHFEFLVDTGETKSQVLKSYSLWSVDGKLIEENKVFAKLSDGESSVRPVVVFWRKNIKTSPPISRALQSALRTDTIVIATSDQRPDDPQRFESQISSSSLHRKVARAREKHRLVGIGALVMVDGKIIAVAADGERKSGSNVNVTVNDKWHHGSITKSMTATVIGRMIQRGDLDWNDNLESLLPEMNETMHDDWKPVTLYQLMTHQSGALPNFSAAVLLSWPDGIDQISKARGEAVAGVLRRKPMLKPGTKFSYSNVGYTIAGYVAAQKAGLAWEKLIREEVFRPLKLSSAGFGAPKGPRALDHPWGHVSVLGIKNSQDPEDGADNSPIMGPAGTVHMTMGDLAVYGWAHLNGERNETGFLKPVILQKLHEPAISDYGCGWITKQPNWAGGRIVWHSGSNTKWYSVLELLPEKNAVFVFVCNDGNYQVADQAFYDLATDIVDELPRED